ncbi:DUF3102 domain-containing protein [Pseudoflavonifractor sp. DSM 107456]|uniref:DUF3102 domain-containing protein n=1 Tax=Pseudoflavonifractor gallinarum TaxID=2779352 RepID=A0ABR9R7U6_9FIRM|nr:DUF3102 domain-containing protein [Pseudoflavonifractor gallinarum]MBE5054765.1 DUF3102 domain-containing protein [Pseudoflavonifractor gallinarum]
MGKPDLGRLIAQTMAQPAEERTIEAVTGDILEAQRKGGEAVLTIGRCLIEAKDMLRHGEWLPWLAEKVGYSEKTAQNFMRLAREFSNPQAIADLGATKALKLLALPADEREQFVADHNVIDMTTRQLEAAIKERDEARAHAQQAEQERSEAQQSAQKLQETLHDVLEDRSDAYQRLEKLTEELDELKARPVEVAVETVVDQEAINKAKDEVRGEMQAKLDKAKEAAARAKYRQQEAEAKLDKVQTQLQDAERARKNAAMAADEDMAAFKVLFQQAQENANKMRGILLKLRAREDHASAQGAEKALKALAEAIGRCVE